MLSEIVREGIQRGLRGENVTSTLTSNPNQFLPTKIGTALPTGQKIYTLVGGESGSGKTAFVDAFYVLNPFLHARKHGTRVPFVIYRSFERPKLFKLVKWLSYFIYYETKGQLEYSVDTILSWVSKKKDLHEGDIAVFERYLPMLDELEQYLQLMPGVVTPESVAENITRVARQLGKDAQGINGKLIVNGVVSGELNRVEIKDGIERRYFEGRLGRVYEDERVYFPNDPLHLVTHVTDHVSLYGQSKEVIDRHSEFIMPVARDIFGCQCVDLNQLNRLTAGQTDQKGFYTLSHFKNTGTLTENADAVVVVVDPANLRMENWGGYSIGETIENGEACFRGLQVIKNSYGFKPSMGMAFYGAAGVWGELPRPPKDERFINSDEMSDRDYQMLRLKQKPIFG